MVCSHATVLVYVCQYVCIYSTVVCIYNTVYIYMYNIYMYSTVAYIDECMPGYEMSIVRYVWLYTYA